MHYPVVYAPADYWTAAHYGDGAFSARGRERPLPLLEVARRRKGTNVSYSVQLIVSANIVSCRPTCKCSRAISNSNSTPMRARTQECEPIDMTLVHEVRIGVGPRDGRIANELQAQQGSGLLDARCINIIIGADLANPTQLNFVASDVERAKVRSALFTHVHNRH